MSLPARLRAFLPRRSAAAPAPPAPAAAQPADYEKSLDAKSKNPHFDTDDEASLQNVAEATEADPELNPGALSFEEGKSGSRADERFKSSRICCRHRGRSGSSSRRIQLYHADVSSL